MTKEYYRGQKAERSKPLLLDGGRGLEETGLGCELKWKSKRKRQAVAGGERGPALKKLVFEFARS